MKVPENYTPMQKWIVETYIEYRSVPKAAVATHHVPHSSFVRDIIHKYKLFLQEEDRRLTSGGSL